MKTIKKLLTNLMLATSVAALAACGGGAGGTGNGGNGGVGAAASLAITVFDSAGVATRSTVAGGVNRAAVLLKNSAGAVVPNTIVKFSISDTTLATLSPVTGTVLTDASGLATINITASSPNPGGAFVVKAEASVAGTIVNSADWAMSVPTSTSAANSSTTLSLVVSDSSAVPVRNLSAGASAKAIAAFSESTGAPIPNALVTFKLSNGLNAVMSPSSGVVLTDASGIAVIDVIALAPNPGGAFAVQVEAISGSTAVKAADWTINVAAATITISGAVHSPVSTVASPLQTGSTTIVSANVSSAGNPVNSNIAFSASSPCISQGKAVFTPIGTISGVFTGSYKNNGCVASPDVLTLSQVNETAATSLNIYMIGSALAEMRFEAVSPSSSSLIIKGGGGFGRVETGTVTFLLLDSFSQPLPGVTVNFALSSRAGGMDLVSPNGVTDAQGKVTATVRSGTVPTPFVVSASTTFTGGGKTVSLSASSSVINISVGLPEQKNFSLSVAKANIEGLNYDDVKTDVTVRLADFWGNKVADGTTVNMVTEGGSIGSSSSGACNTVDGACTLILSSAEFKPANGRVSFTAYAQGPIAFNDLSGVGDFTFPGTTCYHYGDPFIDYDESRSLTSSLAGFSTNRGSTRLNSNSVMSVVNQGIELAGRTLYSNATESYVPYAGGAYTPPTSGLPCTAIRPLRYIYSQGVVTFSGSNAYAASSLEAASLTWPLALSPNIQSMNRGYIGSTVPVSCNDVSIPIRIFDENLNPMPADTQLSVKVSTQLKSAQISNDKILSTNSVSGSFHTLTISGKDEACSQPGPPIVSRTIPAGTAGTVTVEAITPKGIKSSFVVNAVYQ